MYKNKTERFHIEFGPDSLFQRVNFKMKNVTELYLKGEHFNERLLQRKIPETIVQALRKFVISEWRLVTAEVRVDRGKFVNSTWEKVVDGCHYQVTIGLGSCVETIVNKTSSGTDKCVRSGELYDFVSRVNEELMLQEQAEG